MAENLFLNSLVGRRCPHRAGPRLKRAARRGLTRPTFETRYIYDGMRVIQERDKNNVPTVSYTRGSDLSGSLEGAGGIGGLLGRSHGYSSGNWTTNNVYHADGNGNVTYMLNSSQSKVAEYRYDPFGNTISSSGSLANPPRPSGRSTLRNPCGFSSAGA